MSVLDELLGLDPTSPEVLRANLLAENDQALMDALVRVRIKRGMTQAQVAEAMGIKQPTVADFEAHDSNPTLSRIRRYAHAVGALVAHKVEMDSGQLLDDRREQWAPATLNVDVMPTPRRQPSINVATISAARSWSSARGSVVRDDARWALGA